MKYAKIIGNVMLMVIFTCPDIIYVVSISSRYTYNPSSKHQNALRRIKKVCKVTFLSLCCIYAVTHVQVQQKPLVHTLD